MGYLKEAKRTTFKLLSDAEIEAERKAGRKAVRREMAEHLANAKKAEPLKRQLAELDRRADEAADKHQDICQPAQAKIKEIDAQIVDLLAERKDVPAKLESQRSELLAKIHDANEALEKEVHLVKQLKKPIAREISSLDDGGKILTLTNDLCSLTLGHPEWFASYFSAQKLLEWNQAQANDVAKKIRHEEEIAQDPRYEKTAANRQHLRNWKAILARMEKQMDGWKTEMAKLRQKMIDE